MPVLIIVTRPAPLGLALRSRLVNEGWSAVFWPAFEIGPAPDPDIARDTLGRLAEFDLVVFVSANAVYATRALMSGAWPATTLAGAVGATTRRALNLLLASSPGNVIAPTDESKSGSEAFWSTWQASGRAARRVLIVRAQDGRDWLQDSFESAGSAVESVAVYSRGERALAGADAAALRGAISARALALPVITSTEAIGALDRSVSVMTGADAWLRRGIALAAHDRIADKLRDAGYARIERVAADDDGVLVKLELLRATLPL